MDYETNYCFFNINKYFLQITLYCVMGPICISNLYTSIKFGKTDLFNLILQMFRVKIKKKINKIRY